MSRGNEAAYPRVEALYGASHGLTIREHFAAMAMQGLLANPDEVTDSNGFLPETFEGTTRELARRSVAFADALIAELERSK